MKFSTYDNVSIYWQTAPAPVPYPDAVATMEARVAGIADGDTSELVWVLEHPALYTAGTSADVADLIDPDRFPVFQSGAGGAVYLSWAGAIGWVFYA